MEYLMLKKNKNAQWQEQLRNFKRYIQQYGTSAVQMHKAENNKVLSRPNAEYFMVLLSLPFKLRITARTILRKYRSHTLLLSTLSSHQRKQILSLILTGITRSDCDDKWVWSTETIHQIVWKLMLWQPEYDCPCATHFTKW